VSAGAQGGGPAPGIARLAIVLQTFALLAAQTGRVAVAQEDGGGLDAPRPASARDEPREEERAEPRTAEREAESVLPPTQPPERWSGPRVFLGYGRLPLDDGFGQGTAHEGAFGGYAPTGRVRLGAYAALGIRRYALGDDDLLLRASVEVGYQHLPRRGPVVPFLVLEGTVGGLIGKRFSTTVPRGLFGMGPVAGVDVELTRGLHLGVSIGWLRVSLAGRSHDLALFRVRVGL